jgi:molybdate transport system ATP-binding protein
MTLAVHLVKRLPTGFALDVSFLAESGVTILFGASGSGKTTILRCVAGLAQPDGGRIAIGDRTLFDGDSGVRVPGAASPDWLRLPAARALSTPDGGP